MVRKKDGGNSSLNKLLLFINILFMFYLLLIGIGLLSGYVLFDPSIVLFMIIAVLIFIAGFGFRGYVDRKIQVDKIDKYLEKLK